MKIVIIRHGQIQANIISKENANLYIGALDTKDTVLTPIGEKQAKELASNPIVKDIKKVYSSSLRRAIQTAEIAKPDYEICIDKRLKERSLGAFEGKKKEDLIKIKEYEKYFSKEPYNQFRLSFVQRAPEGENYTDVSKRCQAFLNELDFTENTTIGIFSHIHVIRCLFLNILHITPPEKVFKLKIENCVPYVFEGNSIEELKLVSHKLEEVFK